LQKCRNALEVHGHQFDGIECQEEFRNYQACALVAIQEGMITRYAECVAGGEANDRRLTIGKLYVVSRKDNLSLP
jgi:hypothetical protein